MYAYDPALEKFHKENADGLNAAKAWYDALCSNQVSWDNQAFASGFPNLYELRLKQDDLTKASLAVWSAVIGTPTIPASLAYKTALAILLLCTPKEAEESYVKYEEVMEEIGATSAPSVTNIVGALPRTEMSAKGLIGDSSAIDFLTTYFNMGSDVQIPTEIGEGKDLKPNPLINVYGSLEKDTIKHTRDNKDVSSKILVNVFSTISRNEKGGPMTAATIGCSLLIIAGLKGPKAMLKRAKELKLRIGEGPDSNYISNGFDATREILATTLCLIQRAIATQKLELRPEADDCYEKHIQVPTRYNRQLLFGTIVETLTDGRLSLEELVDATLFKKTDYSWNRLFEFGESIDRNATRIVLDGPRSRFCKERIAYFVVPYIRIFSEYALTVLGTSENRVLACCFVGISAGLKDFNRIENHLSGYKPFTSLSEDQRLLITHIAMNAVRTIGPHPLVRM